MPKFRYLEHYYRKRCKLLCFAGVVKLVDALDSKSSGPCAHVGSIPTSGTTEKAVPIRAAFLFYIFLVVFVVFTGGFIAGIDTQGLAEVVIGSFKFTLVTVGNP